MGASWWQGYVKGTKRRIGSNSSQILRQVMINGYIGLRRRSETPDHQRHSVSEV